MLFTALALVLTVPALALAQNDAATPQPKIPELDDITI